MSFESLEDRSMLAGNVTAAVVGGDLVVTGTNGNNQIEIVGDNFGVEVHGLDGTRINGALNGSFDTGDANTGEVNRIRVNMKGGNDVVFVSDVNAFAQDSVLGKVTIIGGAGRDHIEVSGYVGLGLESRIHDLSIFGGGGGDCVKISDVEIGDWVLDNTLFIESPHDLNVNLGGGPDTLVIDNASLYGDMTITAGAGNDKVGVRSSRFSGNVGVDLGAGNDQLAASDSQFVRTLNPTIPGLVERDSNVQVSGGTGNDVIGADSCSFDNLVTINGNAGRDKILATDSVFGGPSFPGSFTTIGNARILGGGGRDYVAASDNDFRGNGRIFGGGGFDNLAATGNGEPAAPKSLVTGGFEGQNLPPNFQQLVDALNAIDCAHAAG